VVTKNKVLVVIICFCISSCASYESIYKKMDKLEITEINIDKITGTYEMFPTLQYNTTRGKTTLFEKPENVSANAYQEIIDKAIKIDTTSKYSMTLICKKEEILFKYFSDTTLIETKVIKGKLNKNGFYYLDNSKIICHGIPYLLGGCKQTKLRLGLSTNGDLIINQAYKTSGAFMFFFWSGEQFNSCYFFKKYKSL
jgi:hypothetical protein